MAAQDGKDDEKVSGNSLTERFRQQIQAFLQAKAFVESAGITYYTNDHSPGDGMYITHQLGATSEVNYILKTIYRGTPRSYEIEDSFINPASESKQGLFSAFRCETMDGFKGSCAIPIRKRLQSWPGVLRALQQKIFGKMMAEQQLHPFVAQAIDAVCYHYRPGSFTLTLDQNTSSALVVIGNIDGTQIQIKYAQNHPLIRAIGVPQAGQVTQPDQDMPSDQLQHWILLYADAQARAPFEGVRQALKSLEVKQEHGNDTPIIPETDQIQKEVDAFLMAEHLNQSRNIQYYSSAPADGNQPDEGILIIAQSLVGHPKFTIKVRSGGKTLQEWDVDDNFQDNNIYRSIKLLCLDLSRRQVANANRVALDVTDLMDKEVRDTHATLSKGVSVLRQQVHAKIMGSQHPCVAQAIKAVSEPNVVSLEYVGPNQDLIFRMQANGSPVVIHQYAKDHPLVASIMQGAKILETTRNKILRPSDQPDQQRNWMLLCADAQATLASKRSGGEEKQSEDAPLRGAVQGALERFISAYMGEEKPALQGGDLDKDGVPMDELLPLLDKKTPEQEKIAAAIAAYLHECSHDYFTSMLSKINKIKDNQERRSSFQEKQAQILKVLKDGCDQLNKELEKQFEPYGMVVHGTGYMISMAAVLFTACTLVYAVASLARQDDEIFFKVFDRIVDALHGNPKNWEAGLETAAAGLCGLLTFGAARKGVKTGYQKTADYRAAVGLQGSGVVTFFTGPREKPQGPLKELSALRGALDAEIADAQPSQFPGA